MLDTQSWEKVAKFHGHVCPGLAIGFKACEAAIEELDLPYPAADEEIVCITENDACGVDAIQSLLSCTLGKSNLILKIRGKQAFTFYNRETRDGIRIVLTAENTDNLSRDEYMNYLLNTPYTELFKVEKVTDVAPEKARIFASQPCSVCGEKTAEFGLRIHNGKPICLDCYEKVAYQREGF